MKLYTHDFRCIASGCNGRECCQRRTSSSAAHKQLTPNGCVENDKVPLWLLIRTTVFETDDEQ